MSNIYTQIGVLWKRNDIDLKKTFGKYEPFNMLSDVLFSNRNIENVVRCHIRPLKKQYARKEEISLSFVDNNDFLRVTA